MLSFILRRLLLAVPTLLGAYLLIFLITRLVPGDPVMLILEENYSMSNATYEAVQQRLGLDQPIWKQFFTSLGNTLQGDFGTSFQNNRPVAANVNDQIGDTVLLAIAALCVSAVIGIPAGAFAALRHNNWQDYTAMTFSLLALCAPGFWLAILLIIVFSLKLGWLPTFGVGEPGNPVSVAKHLVLPAVALGASVAGLVARISRSSMLEVLTQDFVRTARAKGVSERGVIVRHALRNAMLPVITIFGLEAVTLLSGTVITETVFARRGIGKLLIDAILVRDYPQIQALLILFVGIAVVMNIVVDVAYGLVDPRIRMG